MKFMRWKSDYSVKNKLIDSQHKSLNEIINELYEMDVKKDEKRARELLNEFVEKLDEHFDTENKLMTESEYPGYFSHKLEHERALRKYSSWVDSMLKKKKLEIDGEFFNSYKRWFENHHTFQDSKLGTFLSHK